MPHFSQGASQPFPSDIRSPPAGESVRMIPHLLFPLVAALGYTLGSLTLKRGMDYGIGTWRTTFVVNLTAGVLFLPFLFLGGNWLGWEKIYQPLVAGGCFFLGQIYTFRAITHGDVSIVAPVLGTKSILIAGISAVFLRDYIPWTWWVASALCVVAVGLLGGRSHSPLSTVRRTVGLAFVSAVAFSIADVLVQVWVPAWGAGRFLPLMFGTVALLSLSLVPKFHQPLWQIPRGGWKWLLGGSALIAGQAAVMAYAIGVFGNATAMNIVYSTRGVWAIVLVWAIGHWWTSTEQHLGRAVLIPRLLGALLLVAAIALL